MGAPKVLIVGAGPTGLVLALWLARVGVPVRVVDKSAGPGETSRALAVHARTLELYRQLGIADDVVRGGIRVDHVTVRKGGGRAIARIGLGDFGVGLSPFPFVLTFPQDDHERLLLEHLARVGVTVERNVDLVGFAQDDHGVTATLRCGTTTEQMQAAYLCGCDGARSTTREGLGVGFPGGTYHQVFYVADANATGEAADGNVSMCTSDEDFCLVMPVRRTGSVRLIGTVPPEHEQSATIGWDDVAPAIVRDTGLEIERVNWFSTYRVHHRVADRFSDGRVFLLGDAAHIHSPAGGQGMNTGIGDAANLAWKLAAVLRRDASPAVLESYEPERIAFARRLVATTDRVFRLLASGSTVGSVWRTSVLPRLAATLMRARSSPRIAFKIVSQIGIRYRASPLSAGSGGKVHGGDRLPWVPGEDGDNFAPLASLDWQVHVYGAVGEKARAAVRRWGLPLHVLPWTDRARDGGLEQDAMYLVRPDGYVAVAGHARHLAPFEKVLERFAIRARQERGG